MADYVLPGFDFQFTERFSGAAKTYECLVSGTVTFWMWGGGGGGGTYTLNTSGAKGGAGGFLKGQFAVVAGDILTVMVGGGGQTGTVNVRGGDGGWPDGGYGGFPLQPTAAVHAGGGGSSRIYKNGSLFAICGAGGAGHYYMFGGNGGSTTGGTAAGFAQNGKGGSQTAGGGGIGTVTADQGWGLNAGTTINTNRTGGSRPNQSGTRLNSVGSGGGGGWWGGGTNASTGSNQNGAGGGGSSWTKPTDVTNVVSTKATENSGNNPPDPDSKRPANVGVGGAGVLSSTTANGNPGKAGAIILSLSGGSATMLDIGTNEVFATGAQQRFEVPANADIEIEMWGGGGSGGTLFGSTPSGLYGGSAGYAKIGFKATGGDIIEVWVGTGGKKPTAWDGGTNTAGPTMGGQAGWPDGGDAGRWTTANTGYGGGGGSTRVYRNGTLIGVAGGGGGSGGRFGGGPGGGTTGLRDLGYANNGGGGTQSAGGSFGGASLAGGLGYTPGGDRLTPDTAGNAGGGGGYYGGGKPPTNGQSGSGGGGSGYYPSTDPNYFGNLQVGYLDTGLPYEGVNNDRPSGVGEGGACATTLSGIGNGGDGYARIVLLEPEPGDAIGSALPEITTTSYLTTGVQVGFPAGQATAWDDILLSAVVGLPGSPAEVEVSIPDIEMQMFLNATGESQAIVLRPINDGDPVYVTPPEPIPGVGGSATGAALLPIRFTPPRSAISGDVDGDLATIIVTTVDGVGEPVVEAPGELPTVTMVNFDVEYTNGHNITPPSTGGVYASVLLTPPEPDFAFAAGLLGTITLSAPATDFVFAPGLPWTTSIDLSAPEGNYTTDVEGIGDIGIVTLWPPEGSGPVPAEFDVIDMPTVLITAPEPLVEIPGYGTSEAFENVISTGGPMGMGEEAVSPPTAPFPVITFVEPTGYLTGGIGMFGLVGTVQMVPPAGVAGIAQFLNVLGQSLDVLVTVPTVTQELAAKVFPTILPARIELRAPRGIAYEGSEVIAIGGFDDIDILLDAPMAGVQITPEVHLPTIPVDYVDGYVTLDEDDFAPLRFKRSKIAGNIPPLVSREIAINEADGILYTMDADDVIQGTNFLAFRNDKGYAPEGGDAGEILSAAGVWAAADPAYIAPLKMPPPAARAPLTDAVLATTVVTPTIGKVYYRPFYAPLGMKLSDIGVEVIDGVGGSTVWMGICVWDPNTQQPGDTIVLGSVSAATAGMKQILPQVELRAGWYAAMVNVTGTAGATFLAGEAPKTLDPTLDLVGDPTASNIFGLDPMPPVSGRAPDAWAILQADVSYD